MMLQRSEQQRRLGLAMERPLDSYSSVKDVTYRFVRCFHDPGFSCRLLLNFSALWVRKLGVCS